MQFSMAIIISSDGITAIKIEILYPNNTTVPNAHITEIDTISIEPITV